MAVARYRMVCLVSGVLGIFLIKEVFFLLVGTPSAIRPELAFSRAEHSLPYSDVTIFIFAILYLSSMPYV